MNEGAPSLSLRSVERQGGGVHRSQRRAGLVYILPPVPWGLKRFQETRNLHFITFSCYHRAPLLATPEARRIFEQNLERNQAKGTDHGQK